MIRSSCSSAGRSRSTGRRRLSCLAALLLPLALAACGQKLSIERIKTQIVLPPELGCDSRPAVPTVDALARPDGDKALATYIARLEAWGADCEDAVKSLNEWRIKHMEPKP